MKYFLMFLGVLLLLGCESDAQSDSIERKTYRFPSAPSIENTEILEIEEAQFSDAAYYPDGVVMVVETQQELEELYHNLFDNILDPDPIPPDIDFEAYVVIAALGRNHHTSSEITITEVKPLPSGGFTAQVEAFYGDFGIAAMTKPVHIVKAKKRA
ncbi:hypothetical protein U14_00425 [Candidatus Moduliflexus flocculans]|uniref:PrcB C-terminal domain-containing protein n=1 Tax=Candidatus Moduliflexus flocculans TaxID=1499966 RepID=A0A0S6VQC4_9BACT|nr:hypothetical protein U14_00425 [Candidatus Moduliflexus flocculans]